jgi:DNA-binding response OmpR family regulator
MSMRLLLIEDDKMLARGTAAGLTQSGYAVTVAENGAEALRFAAGDAFDIGILDLGLPDMDGIELLREIRAGGIVFPILILSARDGLNDRIRGLDVGADDYLTKPFALGELEARLRALLRRTADNPRWQLLGQFRFDASARLARSGERDIDLTARELSILAVLMKQPRKIVSKQVLFDAVFSYETDAAPNALEVHVSRLRQKLRGTGATIRSLRGLGYRIEEQADAVGRDA